jgi:hypothetical protein
MHDHVPVSLATEQIQRLFTCHGNTYVGSRVEAGYNTSTVVPASRKRRRKGNPVPGVYLGHPVPGGYKYGDLALQVGEVSRIGTMKYVLEPCWTALAKTSSNSKLQTRPLVREKKVDRLCGVVVRVTGYRSRGPG